MAQDPTWGLSAHSGRSARPLATQRAGRHQARERLPGRVARDRARSGELPPGDAARRRRPGHVRRARGLRGPGRLPPLRPRPAGPLRPGPRRHPGRAPGDGLARLPAGRQPLPRGPPPAFPAAQESAHLFACFFQVRRAFHHVFAHIVGASPAARRLRAAVWQSIFTQGNGIAKNPCPDPGPGARSRDQIRAVAQGFTVLYSFTGR